MSQNKTIITIDGEVINAVVISDSLKRQIIQDFSGIQENSLRKPSTARTYKLTDGRILIEFYDREAILLNSIGDFHKIQAVKFFKTDIYFLKKSTTYKIEIPFETAEKIVADKNLTKKEKFKAELLDFKTIDVYPLDDGRVLFIGVKGSSRFAAVYENIKALASEVTDVEIQEYGDLETSAEKFKHGDPLLDYEKNGEHWVEPDDLAIVAKNHQLTLLKKKIYVSDFYGNLYESKNGYYVIIDEVEQPNGGGKRMGILTARVYESLGEVEEAQSKYLKFKERQWNSSHFYSFLSEKHGRGFPEITGQLIERLPGLLNFDKEQLSFDSLGMEIVDEALLWNDHLFAKKYSLFEEVFPSLLAYYGECYIRLKGDGRWVVKAENYEGQTVYIPELILKDNQPAFDPINFYKDLHEGGISIKLAGDWMGLHRDLKNKVYEDK